jgi:DnaJ-class molecular chaperone
MSTSSGADTVDEPCPRCGGSGVIKDAPTVRVGHLPKSMALACPQCRGIGKIRKRAPRPEPRPS